MLKVQRLPAHVLNGASVSLGIALVHVSVAALGPQGTAEPAATGALYASLPHLIHRAGRSSRRALAGGVLGSLVGLLIFACKPAPALLNLAVVAVTFAAMMTAAWGPRAGPIAFTAILAIIFSLASPPTLSLPLTFVWTLCGALIYAAWVYGSTRLLERRYRALALAESLGTAARLLESRAAVLETTAPLEQDPTVRFRQIDAETQLAAQLQSARDLIFEPVPRSMQDAELLLRAIELRDLLLSSRLDLDLLGTDGVALEIRSRLARSLRANAAALRAALEALAQRTRPSLDRASLKKEVEHILDERDLPANDPRLRLLPAIASRQQHLIGIVASIHELIAGAPVEISQTASELSRPHGDERWPLSSLVQNTSWQSPVFRHAVRSAVALGSAHLLSSALPWATHPHWMVLSVAVVLRGNLAQTLSRRNQRIAGTALGCLVALSIASVGSEPVLAGTMWIAAGVAHAFVNVKYTLTATAATVMALLQTRLLMAITPVLLLERLVDTVLGAGFAWAFSYVLPSWSRRTLPETVESTLKGLQAYIDAALSSTNDAEQRLARERAYVSLEALIATVRLGSTEPERVRPPLPPLISFVDHAQTLMAHLSSLRLLLQRRREQLRGPEIENILEQSRLRLSKRLELQAAPYSMPPQMQPLHLELPSVAAEHAALPWLRRRLNVSIYEADRTGQAGRTALSLLHERPLGNSAGVLP